METNWDQEEEGAVPGAELNSLSSYTTSQDTARLENLVERLEEHVVDKIGLASDNKP
jgi:hypothetical protein